MPKTRIVIRETDGLNENVRTLHVHEPRVVDALGGPRGFAIDNTNEAKLNDLLGKLATFVARDRSVVQTITFDFHVAD